MTTFEELLEGREPHELSEDQVKDIITKLKTDPKELDKASSAIRKSRRKASPSKKTQKKKKKAEDLLNNLLLKGQKGAD